MSKLTQDSIDDFGSAVDYFEGNENAIIDNPSGLEFAYFLESVIGPRSAVISLMQDNYDNFYITLDRERCGYIIINSVSGRWGYHQHQEHFVLRARVCEVQERDYVWLHEENSHSYDHKIVFVKDGSRDFVESRRFINLNGGTTAANLNIVLNSFIESTKLLCAALQTDHAASVRKTTAAHAYSNAKMQRH